MFWIWSLYFVNNVLPFRQACKTYSSLNTLAKFGTVTR
jgi:hypothetical protein